MSPRPPICDETARRLCKKIVEIIRKARRPLRRGEIGIDLLESEPRLTAACQYGVREGLLIKLGGRCDARYGLPPSGVS